MTGTADTRRRLATAIGDAHALDYEIADEIVDYLADELAEAHRAQAVALLCGGLAAVAASVDAARAAVTDAARRLDTLAASRTEVES